MINIICICYNITPPEKRKTPQFSINTSTFFICRHFSTRTHHTFGTAHFSRQSEKTTCLTTKLTNYLPCGILQSIFVLKTSQIKENGQISFVVSLYHKSSVILLTGRLTYTTKSTPTSIHDALNQCWRDVIPSPAALARHEKQHRFESCVGTSIITTASLSFVDRKQELNTCTAVVIVQY